jgi:hypothetical protein
VMLGHNRRLERLENDCLADHAAAPAITALVLLRYASRSGFAQLLRLANELKESMHRVMSAALLIACCLVACTHVNPSPPQEAPKAAVVVPQAAAKVTDTTPPLGDLQIPPATAPTDVHTAPAGQATAAPTGAASAPPSTPSAPNSAVPGTAKAPRANAPVKMPPPERTAPPADHASSASAPAKPSTAALDLASLEQRLRDTHAIGVFTKLSLKNQVDDLLDEFRAFHNGQTKTSLAQLRQRYDLLLLKVLTILQDSDPPLASAISASREAIWGILTDREKFQKI